LSPFGFPKSRGLIMGPFLCYGRQAEIAWRLF
jgi:hypothetical protein